MTVSPGHTANAHLTSHLSLGLPLALVANVHKASSLCRLNIEPQAVEKKQGSKLSTKQLTDVR